MHARTTFGYATRRVLWTDVIPIPTQVIRYER